MLDFLHVEYSTEEVLDRLRDNVATFKRPKSAQDFITPQQRHNIYSILREFLMWLKAKSEERMSPKIKCYML